MVSGVQKSQKVNKTLTKNIWKFPKHNLTNNFVGNFNKYSKGNTQIQTMPHPPKKSVIIFKCHRGKSTVKTEYNLKDISKYDKKV